MWLNGTFGLIVLDYIKGGHGYFGLPALQTATVPHINYQDSLDTVHMFLFDLLPTMASGYLLLGLFIFYYIEKAGKDDEKHDHDA